MGKKKVLLIPRLQFDQEQRLASWVPLDPQASQATIKKNNKPLLELPLL